MHHIESITQILAPLLRISKQLAMYLFRTLIFTTLFLMINQEILAQFSPPQTPANPVVDTLHGQMLTDNYQWLEDKEDEAVKAWTKAQHQVTQNYINDHCPPVAGLREEISAYIDRDIISPMRLVADRQFFTLKKKGEAQAKLYTKLGDDDILIFDPEKIDPSGKSSMSGRDFTQKGDRVAVGIQSKGAEISTYYIVDTKTGEMLGAPIEGLRGFAWTKDEKHAYLWVRTKEMIDQQEPYNIYLHTIGTERSEDKFLLKPDNAKNTAAIYDAQYSDVTFISKGDFYATHSLKIKQTNSENKAVEIYANQEFRAYPNAIGDKIYFYTNHEAPNFKLMVADKNNPDFKNWKVLYPEQETVFENYSVTPNYLLIQDKKDVVSRVMLYDLAGKFIRELKLPEIGNVSFVNYNRDVKKVYIGISTFTTPFKIYELDPAELEKETPNWKLFYEQKVPLDMSNIEAKIDFYTSKDGTRVPLFIVHKKGLKLDGSNPTLLYGYGGFNIGMTPSFIGTRGMLVNRGVVYAIACIRGGDEYGENWHKDGMLFKKQNTFDDFIAAAEYLIDQKYTTSKRLAIYGGSNGGLLVGAALTQRPDLFRAVLCAVPLLDMIRFHKFLIAQYWIPEYGDPDKKEDFENILKYSPYHNVKEGVNYPVTMVKAGENDTRVDPLHAKKFVAQVQNNSGQQNPFMLYMDFDSGHGSGKSTEQMIDDMDFQYRFLLGELGVK